MPSQKPRIALTVPDDINEVLDRISQLTNTPKSKLIVEMLEQYMPVFEQVAQTIEKIKTDKDNGKTIAKQFAQDLIFDSHEVLAQIAKEAKDL